MLEHIQSPLKRERQPTVTPAAAATGPFYSAWAWLWRGWVLSV